MVYLLGNTIWYGCFWHGSGTVQGLMMHICLSILSGIWTVGISARVTWKRNSLLEYGIATVIECTNFIARKWLVLCKKSQRNLMILGAKLTKLRKNSCNHHNLHKLEDSHVLDIITMYHMKKKLWIIPTLWSTFSGLSSM